MRSSSAAAAAAAAPIGMWNARLHSVVCVCVWLCSIFGVAEWTFSAINSYVSFYLYFGGCSQWCTLHYALHPFAPHDCRDAMYTSPKV